MIKYIIMTLVIFAIYMILQIVCRNMILKKLALQIQEEKYEEFEKTVNGVLCFLTVKPFLKENMKLSAYIIQDKEPEVKKQIELIQKMRIKPQQKIVNLSHAFYYFLGKKNQSECHTIMNAVKELGDMKSYQNLEMQYSIILLKESRYIDEVKKKLEIAQKRDNLQDKNLIIGILQYFIGLQYSYLNDEKNMLAYLTPALKNCQGTPYEEEIRSILGNRQA